MSDIDRRKSAAGQAPRVAVLQHASQALLEEGVRGMLDGLAAAGFVQGKNIVIERFNAENDVATGNAIARQITSGGYDLVLTSSTRSLQAVANANRDGRVKHVFGIVADPSVAGVGVSKTNPLEHPKHLVGIGSFIPPGKAFQLARRMYPGLKSIGVAWNPSEANSEAFVIKAREACREMGIDLVEVAVDNSSAVGEASSSLVSRGVDALWIGGDVTVLVGIDSAISAARQGRIPVFSITPPNVERGALFDVGADFHTVGEEVGELAARVLKGADLTKIPIRNEVPDLLLINRGALKGLKDPWQIPPDVLTSAKKVLDGIPGKEIKN
jgi:putative ABC transport system substrate-binding protein